MKKTKTFKIPLYLMAFFAFALIFTAVLKGNSWQPFAAIISVINTGPQQDGTFYIDPTEVKLEVTDSYEFSAFMQAGTGQIPLASQWTATRKNAQNQDEPAGDIGLPNCNQAPKCTVVAGDISGEVTLHATTNNQQATAKLIIEPGVVKVEFKDEVPHWASQAIGALQKRNIIGGYEDGRFAAGDKVTRAQFITMLYRLMPYYQIEAETLISKKNCEVHTDVASTHFAYKPVCFGYHYGWEKGLTLEGNNLLPDKVLTRQEAAQLLYNAIARHTYATLLLRYDRTLEDSPSRYSASMFKDMSASSPYAEAIGVVANLSLMEGVQEREDRNFYPLRELNRAEAATLIWRTMSTIDWLTMIRATEGF